MASLYCSPDLVRPSMTFLAVPFLRVLIRYASFSASVRLDLVCIETPNCSQKVFQLNMFLLNVGTSRLGSLTDLASGAGEAVLVLCEQGAFGPRANSQDAPFYSVQ